MENVNRVSNLKQRQYRPHGTGLPKRNNPCAKCKPNVVTKGGFPEGESLRFLDLNQLD